MRSYKRKEHILINCNELPELIVSDATCDCCCIQPLCTYLSFLTDWIFNIFNLYLFSVSSINEINDSDQFLIEHSFDDLQSKIKSMKYGLNTPMCPKCMRMSLQKQQIQIICHWHTMLSLNYRPMFSTNNLIEILKCLTFKEFLFAPVLLFSIVIDMVMTIPNKFALFV